MALRRFRFRALRNPLLVMVGDRQRPPPFSGQLPSSPSLSVELPLPGSSFDLNCTQLEASECAWKEYGTSMYDASQMLRRRRGYARKGPNAVLPATDALESTRKRGTQEELPDAAGTRKRVDKIHFPPVLGKEVVGGRAERWNPGLKGEQRAAKC